MILATVRALMRKIRYCVAASLDGYIAGPNGEADWIVSDPDVDFAALWAQFDTLLMGRRTYEPAIARLGQGAIYGRKTIVVSRTLQPADHLGVSIISDLNHDSIKSLRAQSKKDIWLFGGGELFRSLLALHEVDAIELSIMPVILGAGIPLLPSLALQNTLKSSLKLTAHKIYRSGIASLIYEVQH